MKLTITPVFDYLFFIRSKTYNKFFKMRPNYSPGCLMGFRLELSQDIEVVYTANQDDMVYGMVYFASENDLINLENFYGFPFFFKKEKYNILVPNSLNFKDNIIKCDMFIRTDQYKSFYKNKIEAISNHYISELSLAKFPKI